MSVDNYVERLVVERAKAWEAQKELVVKAADEKRELTADEKQIIEKTDEVLDGYDRDIKSWEERTRAAAIADEARESVERMVKPASSAAASGAPSESDAFRSFLRADAGAPKVFDVDFRPVLNRGRATWRTMHPGSIYRDLVEDTAASGGTLVPTLFASTLYDFLEVYTGMRRTGATILSTSGGETMEFPKVANHGTAAPVGEGTALAEADPVFGAMILNAYKYGQLLQVSNELLADSGVDVLGFIANDTARALGRVTDTKYVLGTGASNTPQGIMTAAATGSTSVNGGTGVPNYGNLIDLIYSVNSEYRQMNPVWLTKDSNIAAIRKMVDTTNRPIWEPSFQAGEPDRLLGYPVIEDPNVTAFATATARTMAFGAFSAFYIRDVQGVRFERSDDFAFDKDLVTFRAILRTDSDLIDTNAVKIMVGGSTA